MGGLLTLLYHTARIIVIAFNRKQLEAKAIRQCYFNVDIEGIQDLKNDMQPGNLPALPLKLNMIQKISVPIRFILRRVLCKWNKDFKYKKFFRDD